MLNKEDIKQVYNYIIGEISKEEIEKVVKKIELIIKQLEISEKAQMDMALIQDELVKIEKDNKE